MVENHEVVQFALHLNAPSGLSAIKLWGSMFGADPTGFQTLAPGHTQAQGEVDGFLFIVISQESRVDLLIQGVPRNDASPTPSSLRDFEAAINQGLRFVTLALPSLEVGRAATVLQGSSLASSRQEAAIKVKNIYSKIPVPDGAVEISYQVAVPKKSQLSRHRVIQQICRLQTVQLSMVMVQQNQSVSSATTLFAAHAYVDVYGELLEALDERGTLEAINEVTDIAKRIYLSGFDELF